VAAPEAHCRRFVAFAAEFRIPTRNEVINEKGVLSDLVVLFPLTMIFTLVVMLWNVASIS
jgi:hypothetical protein